jgi:hypothetical protein
MEIVFPMTLVDIMFIGLTAPDRAERQRQIRRRAW